MMINKIRFISSIQLIKFIYYNYLCKNVKREGRGKLIPFKNAIIQFEKGSTIYLKDDNLEIGINKLKNSHAETYLRLGKKSIWFVNGYCGLSYGCTIELLESSIFNTGFFTANCNSVIILKKNIIIGNNVMIGRNCVIYDSDFHPIFNKDNKIINNDKNVIIEDNVWIGSNVLILKGSYIHEGAIIGAGSQIIEEVQPNCIIITKNENIVLTDSLKWNRF